MMVEWDSFQLAGLTLDTHSVRASDPASQTLTNHILTHHITCPAQHCASLCHVIAECARHQWSRDQLTHTALLEWLLTRVERHSCIAACRALTNLLYVNQACRDALMSHAQCLRDLFSQPLVSTLDRLTVCGLVQNFAYENQPGVCWMMENEVVDSAILLAVEYCHEMALVRSVVRIAHNVLCELDTAARVTLTRTRLDTLLHGYISALVSSQQRADSPPDTEQEQEEEDMEVLVELLQMMSCDEPASLYLSQAGVYHTVAQLCECVCGQTSTGLCHTLLEALSHTATCRVLYADGTGDLFLTVCRWACLHYDVARASYERLTPSSGMWCCHNQQLCAVGFDCVMNCVSSDRSAMQMCRRGLHTCLVSSYLQLPQQSAHEPVCVAVTCIGALKVLRNMVCAREVRACVCADSDFLATLLHCFACLETAGGPRAILIFYGCLRPLVTDQAARVAPLIIAHCNYQPLLYSVVTHASENRAFIGCEACRLLARLVLDHTLLVSVAERLPQLLADIWSALLGMAEGDDVTMKHEAVLALCVMAARGGQPGAISCRLSKFVDGLVCDHNVTHTAVTGVVPLPEKLLSNVAALGRVMERCQCGQHVTQVRQSHDDLT